MKPSNKSAVPKDLLSPSDRKVYTRVRKAIVRSPDQTLLTVNLPIKLKEALAKRAWHAERDMSPLVVAALTFMEDTDWKGVPLATKIR